MKRLTLNPMFLLQNFWGSYTYIPTNSSFDLFQIDVRYTSICSYVLKIKLLILKYSCENEPHSLLKYFY